MWLLISWLVAAPFILALTIFSFELIFGLWPPEKVTIHGDLPTTVMLVPAHNEALGIGQMLEQLVSVINIHTRILVIADNCTDQTASIVRSKGIDVVERHMPTERGKGFALAFGRDYLKANPPKCVIVFDADCETDRTSLAELSLYCVQKERVIQAKYTLAAEKDSALMVQISNFAFWVKNVVRQRGTARLGGNALLAGTGMAFPWPLFSQLPLATSSVVEDLSLGIHLTHTGNGPVYLEQVAVVSASASAQATLVQRSRWEGGFVSTARAYALPSLTLGVKRGNWAIFLLGLTLLVPPLALLILTSAAVVSGLCIATLFVGFAPASLALVTCLAVTIVGIGLAWVFGGKQWLGIEGLTKLPLYIFWKIPIFVNILLRKKPDWTRTDRGDDRHDR